VFPETGRVALEEFVLPGLGPRDVQVRTLCSLMSIGTETITLHQKYAHDSHFCAHVCLSPGQDRDHWTQRRLDRLFLSSVQDRRFDLSDLITHRFTPAACVTTYALPMEQRERVMDILSDWTDAGVRAS